jgi:hypothetical protein
MDTIKNESNTQIETKTKMVNGVEIPNISFIPSYGVPCYVPYPVIPELYIQIDYYSDKTGKHLIANGMCYPLTEEGERAAIMHAKAMLGIC